MSSSLASKKRSFQPSLKVNSINTIFVLYARAQHSTEIQVLLCVEYVSRAHTLKRDDSGECTVPPSRSGKVDSSLLWIEMKKAGARLDNISTSFARVIQQKKCEIALTIVWALAACIVTFPSCVFTHTLFALLGWIKYIYSMKVNLKRKCPTFKSIICKSGNLWAKSWLWTLIESLSEPTKTCCVPSRVSLQLTRMGRQYERAHSKLCRIYIFHILNHRQSDQRPREVRERLWRLRKLCVCHLFCCFVH